ncbi:hypothetical protein [sulfur-oxidizing endosymbiont of Gigantopelta aegis]|uniref:hypothetical protein n=1 Tax=sulfur-oxidizing endosymbiont of Gigantopelta aegis TaxID=2794934 RepID=UPI0018DC71FF|nr:hypothetical protein [sulfur-oxidizing endosymbiont of Gigantopelta aegis]
MEALFRLFADICRFKKGPQDVPAANNLLLLLLAANFVLEVFLGLSIYAFLPAVILSSLSVVVLFAFSWFWLMMFKLKSRFLQLATTFMGVSLFTNVLLFLPILFLWKSGVISDDSYGLLNLVLIFWVLSIYAHLYKYALNVSFFLGFALAITYFITFNTLSINLLGV